MGFEHRRRYCITHKRKETGRTPSVSKVGNPPILPEHVMNVSLAEPC